MFQFHTRQKRKPFLFFCRSSSTRLSPQKYLVINAGIATFGIVIMPFPHLTDDQNTNQRIQDDEGGGENSIRIK